MAIFTESQRYGGTTDNAFAILESATYLTEEESGVYPADIPVAQNTRIGHYTVKFEDIAQLAEAKQVDYIDAMLAVAEHNQIEPASLAVVVNEADIIADPQIVYGLANVVVAPVSENSLAAKYCNAVIDAFQENSDDQFLYDALVEDAALDEFLSLQEEENGKGITDSLKDAGKAAKNKAVAAYKQAKEVLGKAATQSRQWISSKIAWLRGLYKNFLDNADAKKNEPGLANVFRQLAAKILTIIDKLMSKIGKAVNVNDGLKGGAIASQHANLDRPEEKK